MGRHFRGGKRHKSYGNRSVGLERALKHIREAETLSSELGGTDKDVKEYFFSLPLQFLSLKLLLNIEIYL